MSPSISIVMVLVMDIIGEIRNAKLCTYTHPYTCMLNSKLNGCFLSFYIVYSIVFAVGC